MNGTIGLPVGLGIRFAAEVEVAPGSGAGFGLGQVGGITVYHEEHVTGMVTNGDGGVSGGVVQQMGKCFHCGLGAVGLCGSEGAEGDEHCVVDRPGIVQECAYNFLESEGAGCIERIGGVSRVRVLSASSVVGLVPVVGRVLGSGRLGMLETLEGFGNVRGHGEVTGTGSVVPFQGDAAVEVGGPVGGDFVLLS